MCEKQGKTTGYVRFNLLCQGSSKTGTTCHKQKNETGGVFE